MSACLYQASEAKFLFIYLFLIFFNWIVYRARGFNSTEANYSSLQLSRKEQL